MDERIDKVIEIAEKIDKAVEYQTKLLETIVTSIDENRHAAGAQKDSVVKNMEALKGVLMGHPVIGSNPQIADAVRKMFAAIK